MWRLSIILHHARGVARFRFTPFALRTDSGYNRGTALLRRIVVGEVRTGGAAARVGIWRGGVANVIGREGPDPGSKNWGFVRVTELEMRWLRSIAEAIQGEINSVHTICGKFL